MGTELATERPLFYADFKDTLPHNKMVKVDFDAARKILEEEAHEARTIAMKGPWVERVRALGQECESKNHSR